MLLKNIKREKEDLGESVLFKRLISTFVLVVITALGLSFNLAFIFIILSITFLALYEYFALVEKKGVYPYKYFGSLIGLIIPLTIFFKFELTKGWELLFVVLGLFSLFILQIVNKKNSEALFSISVTVFGIVYISWLFSFLVRLKLMSHGVILVGALIFITKGSDIGAYLVGSQWGRHLLISRISPKKTIEGLIGAIVFGIFAAFLSRGFLLEVYNFTNIHIVLLGAGLAVIGQLGDLSESLIKRDCQAKDSNRIFPGIGGIMDVIDSILFTAPVFYFYISKFVYKL